MRSTKEDILKAKALAAPNDGRSAEEKDLQIPRTSVTPSLHDAISQMPDVGEDSDFERIDDFGRPVEL